MSTTLILSGLLGLLVCLLGVVKGGVRRVGLSSRTRSAQGFAVAFVVMMVGGALAPAAPVEVRPVADAPTSSITASPAPRLSSPSPSASPSASPSSSPSTTAGPTPTRVAAGPTPASTDDLVDQADDRSALALLGRLAVKGRGPTTGYSRDQYGRAWADTDRNGCDTRNDVLRRDLTDITYRAGTRDCVVTSGQRSDPYTGRTIRFTRSEAHALQIDHVVSLSDAWQTGAATWPAGKRLAFANDPLNLIAVDGPTNASKSDADAATWLPPHKPGRCPMVARQVAVKAKYGLWVKPAERDAIARVLTGCPGAEAPTSSHPTLAPASGPTAPAPQPAEPEPAPSEAAPRPPAPEPAQESGTDPDYGTCKEANANGKGPYYQGRDPEYDWYRDNDKDGMVCE